MDTDFVAHPECGGNFAKRSSWITRLVGLQLLYVLAMVALPIYLLALTRAARVQAGPDAAKDIAGLRSAALILAVPALIALVAWFGLWKEKLWGWWAVLLTDLGLFGAFVYSMIDDGWANFDWDMVALTAWSVLPVVLLLLPSVRKYFWCGTAERVVRKPTASEL